MLAQPYEDPAMAQELARQALEEEIATPSPAAQRQTASVVELIARAVLDPNMDLDRMERLVTMRDRMLAKEAETAFADAFARMQPNLPIIEERGAITNNSNKVQSTYAKWDDINEGIRPHLAAHGFALNFRISQAADKVIIRGILRHSAGHTDETEIILPVDMTGNKNGVQGVGSSISYGQRYTAKLLLNLSSRKGEDDDGQAGGAAPENTAVAEALNEIGMCTTAEELATWHTGKAAGLSALLSPADHQIVVRTFNTKKRQLRGEAIHG